MAELAGLGIIQVPHYRIKQELAENKLKIILPEMPPPPIPVSMLYLQNCQLSQRIRRFNWNRENFQYAEQRGAPLTGSGRVKQEVLRLGVAGNVKAGYGRKC